MKKLLVFLMLFSATSISSAATSCNGTTACDGPARELITQVFPTNDANPATLLTSPVVINGLSCSPANGGANVRLEKPIYDSAGNVVSGHRSFEETYALVLTALAANENIIIRIEENASVCTVKYIAWQIPQ